MPRGGSRAVTAPAAACLSRVPATPHCSASQLRRVLAAAEHLPVDMRLALDLQSRSHPEDCWQAALTQRLHEANAGAPSRRGDGAMLNGAVAVTASAMRNATRGATAAKVGRVGA